MSLYDKPSPLRKISEIRIRQNLPGGIPLKMNLIMRFHTVKKALVYIRIICLYKEGRHTVRNMEDLNSFIKTKISILTL